MIVYTVSIFMLTYNQEAFISQAIEGVLMQKTDFRYQLVIGEDCSSDATLQICESYAAQYGDRIKLLASPAANGGLIANYMRTIAACDGTYIAICDGDDYWIDENKLQKQVDFLNRNPSYSIVYTAVQRLFNDGQKQDYRFAPKKSPMNFEDLIFDNFIYSVTALFKNPQLNGAGIPQWIGDFPFGDWQTYLWVVKDSGDIHFLDEITSVYRMDIGVSANYMKKNSSFIKILEQLLQKILDDPNFKNRKYLVFESLINKKRNLIASYNKEQEYKKGLQTLLEMIKMPINKYEIIKFYGYSIFKNMTKFI